jgi:glycosyltransferase involved in cell wall biosynthesis
MYKQQTICVIIPAFNEESFISKVVQSIPDYVDRIIVVDDASRDLTVQCARETGESRLEIIECLTNQGVGGAMVIGYLRGLELKEDILVKVDGDGQMPIERLTDLLDVIVHEGYDYAKGNRLLDRGWTMMPRHRVLGNVLLTLLTKPTSGYWHIFDPQNGYTAITLGALRLINLDRVHKGFFFENSMLVNLNIHNKRVVDVPMPALYGDEKSSVSIPKILGVFPFLFAKYFIYRIVHRHVLRDFSPIALLLGLGGLFMVSGGGFGLFLWIRSITSGIESTTGSVMLAMLPLILGFQMILQAMVLDINETPR